MEGDPDPDYEECGFKLIKRHLRGKQVASLIYGDVTGRIPDPLGQAQTLQVVGNYLVTDDDIYELHFKDGKICIGDMKTTDENQTGYSPQEKVESKKQDEDVEPSTGNCTIAKTDSGGVSTPDVRRIIVTRITGQINGTPADAVVNTIGRDLDLSSGYVSRALLHSAGDELQSDLRQYPRGTLQFGEIVVTSAYRLQGCRYVLHGAVDTFTRCRNTKGLHKFVLGCLEEADRLQCHTISFPAIGTGNLGYPRHLLAHTMYNAVREYEGRQSHLEEVKFVIYHGDKEAIKAFENKEKEHADYYDGSGRLKETIQIGAVAMSVEYGTLMDVFDECLVYIWERKNSYNAKVQDHELLKMVGDAVQRQWTSHRDNKNKRAQRLQTTGGNLPVSHIIHVFSEDNYTALDEAIQEGLQAADSYNNVTVFFDKKNKFVRYGDQCAISLISCVNERQGRWSRQKRICMAVDSKSLASSFIGAFRQSAKTLDKGRAEMDSKQAPVSLKNERGTEGESSDKNDHSLQAQIAEWRDNTSKYLTQAGSCGYYVLAKQQNGRVSNKNTKLLSVKLENGETKALVKCESRKKADNLFQSNQQEYEKLPIQSLHDYRFKPRKSSGKETELRKMDVHSCTEDRSWIAPTIYQLKCALGITKHDTDRERKESQGFDHVMQCSSEIWPIVKERNRICFQTLKKHGHEVSYETEQLHIPNISSSDVPPEIEVIEYHIKKLEEMSIIEVGLDQANKKSDLDIQEWCKSIEQQHGKECCMFYKENYSVLIFCDSYENAQEVKQQIMVKDDQAKVEPSRGQTVLNDPQDTESSLPESSTATEEPDIIQSMSADHRGDKDRGRKGEKKSINPEFTLEKQSKILERYTTDEGIQVLVYQANILKLPVDCIVNAANDSLQHGGGVARVIAQAAGRTLDNEGFAYIGKHGKVQVGKACVTTAGTLHYACVIHTVGPCWFDYRPYSRTDVQRCEKDLYSAIMESFLEAENRGLESIALPAISAAIFAVPSDLCVYHYAKATLDYSCTRSPTCLREIHFVDINPAIISSIQRVFTAFLKDKRDPGYSTDRYVKMRKSSFSDSHDAPLLSEMANNSRDISAVGNETVTIIRDKCILVMSCEDIMQVKADVIVSPEDLQGSGKGYIAKQIHGKLGSTDKRGVDNDKKKFFGYKANAGDVYVSFVSTPYKYILHAVIPYETRTSSKEEKMQTIYLAFENVFLKVDEKHANSAVMGLLVAGSGSYDDVQTATDAFIRVFENYCEKTRRFQPLHVTLVCKNQDVFKQVKKMFKDGGLIQIPDVPPRTQPALPPKPSSERGPLDKCQQKDDYPPTSLETCVICMDEITDKKVLNCGHAFDKDCIDQAFKFKKVCPTCGVVCGELTEGNKKLKETLHIGPVTVSVEFGTVIDVSGDCLMYIWDKQKSYNVKVRDHEFLKAAGESVQGQWTTHRDNKNKRGQILKTEGGNLNVSTIIHVFSEDNPSGLHTSIHEGLQAAENYDTVTIFFDKSNQFARFEKECVDSLLAYVTERQSNRSSQKRISVVADNKRMAKLFIYEFIRSTKMMDKAGNEMSSPQTPVRDQVHPSTATFEEEIRNKNSRADDRIGCDRNTSPNCIHKDGQFSQNDTNTNRVARTENHPEKISDHSHDSESTTIILQGDGMEPGEPGPAKRLCQSHDESPTRVKHDDAMTSRSTPSDRTTKRPDPDSSPIGDKNEGAAIRLYQSHDDSPTRGNHADVMASRSTPTDHPITSPDRNFTSGKNKGAVEDISKIGEPDLTRGLVHGADNDSPADETSCHQGYSPQEKVESKNQEEEEPYTGSCAIAKTDSGVAKPDVDNSSEALPSLDINQTSDNVEDRAGENDTVSITGVENSSDVLPSLDINQTSDRVEDTANENDTDSSDDEGTGLEICLIVDFQTKVNGKLQNFARPFYITLTQDNFLKWQFICANQQMLEQRLHNMRGDFEKIIYDDGTLKVSLGKQRRNPDLDELANKIQKVFLENTESFIINWFPSDMQINNSVAAKELNTVLQQSDIWKNKDIYMCTTNSGQIRLVFDRKQKKTVDELIQTAIQECCDIIMPKSANRKISLPVVYGQLLHQMNIVEKIESKFPDVNIMYDISYSSNQCSLELVGPDSAVGEADRWIKDNFVHVYTSEKIKCTGVDNWLRQLDVSTLIREQLLSKCLSDVFWMMHRPTQTVWLCSSDRRNLQNTVTEVRTCLKQSHIVMGKDEMSMDAVEKMLVWIGGMEDILGRKVAVNVFADNSGVNICITGGCSYVESLAGRIRQFVNEETSVLP